MMTIKISCWVTAYVKFFKEEKPFNMDSIEQYIMILIDDYHDKWREVGIPEQLINFLMRSVVRLLTVYFKTHY